VVVRLDEIVARFGGEIVGAGDTAVSRIATLENAGPGELAFLANPKYRHQLATTRAAAVIMAPPAVPGPAAAILTAQPYLYYARVAQWLNPPPAPERRQFIRARWWKARSPPVPAVGAECLDRDAVRRDRRGRRDRRQLQHRGRTSRSAIDSRLGGQRGNLCREVASGPAAWCIRGP
jgi:hypothetical protein